MDELEILNKLKEQGLPSVEKMSILENELSHYLLALKQGNTANRRNAIENVEALMQAEETTSRGGIPGRPFKKTALNPRVIELINETIHTLRMTSSGGRQDKTFKKPTGQANGDSVNSFGEELKSDDNI